MIAAKDISSDIIISDIFSVILFPEIVLDLAGIEH